MYLFQNWSLYILQRKTILSTLWSHTLTAQTEFFTKFLFPSVELGQLGMSKRSKELVCSNFQSLTTFSNEQKSIIWSIIACISSSVLLGHKACQSNRMSISKLLQVGSFCFKSINKRNKNSFGGLPVILTRSIRYSINSLTPHLK